VQLTEPSCNKWNWNAATKFGGLHVPWGKQITYTWVDDTATGTVRHTASSRAGKRRRRSRQAPVHRLILKFQTEDTSLLRQVLTFVQDVTTRIVSDMTAMLPTVRPMGLFLDEQNGAKGPAGRTDDHSSQFVSIRKPNWGNAPHTLKTMIDDTFLTDK
jgi:hypothetical protein